MISDDWAAGFLAGEGLFRVAPGSLPWWGSPEVAATSVCLPHLEALADWAGGGRVWPAAARRNRRARASWCWQVRGALALGVCRRLAGRLGPEKDPQLALVLEWPGADRDRRAEIRRELGALKRVVWARTTATDVPTDPHR